MSEGHVHSGSCGCGKPASQSCSTSTKKESFQNGKGDAPRNVSLQFRNNYDVIQWGSSRSSSDVKPKASSKIKTRSSKPISKTKKKG